MCIKLYLDPEKFKKEEYSKWDLSLQVPMCRMLHRLSYQGGLCCGEGCVVWKTLSTQSCKRHERKKASRLISLQLFWTWLHVPWLAKKERVWFFTGDTEYNPWFFLSLFFHYFFCPPSSSFSKSSLIAQCSSKIFLSLLQTKTTHDTTDISFLLS